MDDRTIRGLERYSKIENSYTKYKGHNIQTEKQGIKWTAAIKESGKISFIQIPGKYDTEQQAIDAAKSMID